MNFLLSFKVGMFPFHSTEIYDKLFYNELKAKYRYFIFLQALCINSLIKVEDKKFLLFYVSLSYKNH